ncbi:PREDICTED: mini-chromosome maintenance complex-binding protein-like [Tarenaya hassleriana]|uniref:mini-chromosome maintenance complex-binding protein-like n=1 Tax=Tarenaya hassleriana TaxID=28532 RepID=UPI00053C2E1D|nr:PREDICTED: mini-chromosome maintenance complex-binding protein-like [Tarenaya hassleriana]
MGGPPYDCRANPLGAVRFTLNKAISSVSDPAAFDGKDWGAVDLFRQLFSDDSALSQVPILDSSSIKRLQPNTLVRFRGMIQDMLGNEFYAGAYKDGSTWRTNKYSDVSQLPAASSPDIRVWERHLLHCIPVPGQNSWIESPSEELESCFMDLAGQHREKRAREDEENESEIEFRYSLAKKMRAVEGPSFSESLVPGTDGTPTSLAILPSADRECLPCLVKIYDSPEADLKLNDVVEFVGVLTFDPNMVSGRDAHDELSEGLEADMVQLPPGKVPRLHSLVHRKLEAQHFLSAPSLIEPKSPKMFKEIRESLMKYLTGLLGNDDIAAQFVLLHLLSKVHGRVDDVVVGKLSLNLTGLNKESMSIFGTRLNHALKSLLPFTQSIPLTIEYLNTISLAPKKDYQINRLVPGALQLADGTHLTFDETQLQSGTLNSVGVENARLLKNLLEYQKLEYDFQYYKMEMSADVQVLIFSKGKSNTMPADLVVPFQPSEANSFESVAPEAAETWRWYLATCRTLPYSIGQEIQQVVENDLVAVRQADRSLGSQDLSRLLTMARLMSASFGETTLSLEHWQMVLELERLGRERLKLNL